jgi:hypothetical protein
MKFSIFLESHGLETGKPITFEYSRNKEPSPKNIPGDPYQQKIEPAGIYVTQGKNKLPNYENGTMTFNNPLVLPLNKVEGNIYDENSWKMVLYKEYGKKGKNLSKHLVKMGFDGIITYDKYGMNEIVSLKPFMGLVTEDRTDEQRKFLHILKDIRKKGGEWLDVDDVMKYIMDLSKHGVSYSKGELNIREIRTQLLNGGYYYVLHDIPLDKLYISKDTEELIRGSQLDDPRIVKDKTKQPIVVSTVDGNDFFVVDGRHRVIKARNDGDTQIQAYIPLKTFGKYFYK